MLKGRWRWLCTIDLLEAVIGSRDQGFDQALTISGICDQPSSVERVPGHRGMSLARNQGRGRSSPLIDSHATLSVTSNS